MRVWFITGGARGLGRELVEAALRRGDRVVATTRHPAALDDLLGRWGDALLPLALDPADRDATVAAVDHAVEVCGRLDVVVNNSAFGLLGAVEEVSETEARRIFDVNLFGAMWVCQGALPHLRAQRSGHIVQISSVAGVTAFPMIGMYCATKAALEALSESLAGEVAGFGIRVTLVEPGAMRTGWVRQSMRRVAAPRAAYASELSARLQATEDEYRGESPVDPERVADQVMSIVESREPPFRVLMGDGAYDLAVERRTAVLTEWARSEQAARAAEFRRADAGHGSSSTSRQEVASRTG